ncbi:MAG: amidohydrolase family protein [Deltaproteobacteria bacterium]
MTSPTAPQNSSSQVFKIATETNASLLGFASQIGCLEPGRCAELVLLDYTKIGFPYTDPTLDPVDVLLYRGSSAHVHTVIVNGQVVVESGKVLSIDEDTVAGRLAEAASRPRTERGKALVQAMDELKRHVLRYYEGWPEKLRFDPYFAVNSRSDGEAH